MDPEVLGRATRSLVIPADPRLIVGFALADDAGVVRVDAEKALVQTVDFFTPIVDDPYTFGAIAATNALSDVYAMGGTPLCAMNVLCFPKKTLGEDVLAAILHGGADKLAEAGTMLVGGHSVRDPELKFGMSVTGWVHPDRVWTNAGVRPGDVLVLTKAIGTGVLTTARKRDAIPEEALELAVASMLRLNRGAMEAALPSAVHAATDVTGNGLAGHAFELARASGVTIAIDVAAVPLLPGAREAAGAGHVPGGTASNRRYVSAFSGTIGDVDAALLFDPQTSGGLLIAVPPPEVDALLTRLRSKGEVAAIVGEAREGPPQLAV